MRSKQFHFYNSLLAVFGCLIFALALPLHAQSPVPTGAKVEKIASGFQFVEGPVWRSAGYVVFSDINGNTIYKWTPSGGKEVFLKPSGNSNGLIEDREGRLILCQHGKRRVARIEANGTEIALADKYSNKKLNSPNDLTIKSDNSIYFTDPPYGINSSQEELHYYGIYRLSPKGELTLLDKTLIKPNGIAFSPDESRLYVDDCEKLEIYVWDVQTDGSIKNKRLLYKIPGSGGADGMDIDINGNLYVTGPGAVWIIKPNGTLLDKIPVPETPANVCWGDADFQSLYITARTGLYRIHLNVKGMKTAIQPTSQKQTLDFKLFNNYPNPFNPVTTISFVLSQSGPVRLEIFDTLGRQVSTVVDNYLPSGIHHYNWQADDFASGTYFCRLQSEDFHKSIPMLLVK